MPLIHHVVQGDGASPIVFVHGFACARGDWAAQVAHFSPRHRTVAVDLRGHGASAGTPGECSIERYGADVAELLDALDLKSAVLVGHSMGCRVATEAALQVPSRVAALVLIDASQFASGMTRALQETFACPDGFVTLTSGWFRQMFTPSSDPAVVASVVERAGRLARPIGEKVILDLVRYDVTRFASSLADLRTPVMAIQSTYSNERRERRSLRDGQSSPLLDMLRQRIAGIRIQVISDTGHFPQIEEAAKVNALIEAFIADVA